MNEARGFTLLELLVAMTLLGLVVGIAFGSFQAGLTSYRRGASAAEATQIVRGPLALLAADLERSLPTQGESDAFTAARLSLRQVIGGDSPELARITYAIDGGRLLRQQRGSGAPGRAQQPTVLLSGAEDLAFEFLTEAGWAPSSRDWPRAVRLTGRVIHGQRRVPLRTAIALPALDLGDAQRE